MTGFAVRLQAFQGEVPRLDPRTLGDAQAQLARNVLLTSGTLQPVYLPKRVTTAFPVEGAKTVYRMYDEDGNAFWLSWDSDVDVVKGPIVGDERFRIFFTSDAFEPCYTDLATATASMPYPAAAYVLGIPAPVTAPAAAQDGTGAGTNEERAYVYTVVDAQGWESAPSPASAIVTGKPDAVWTVSGFDPLPPNSGTVTSATCVDRRATLTLDTVFCLRQWETIVVSGIPGLTGRLRILELDEAAKTVVVAAPSGIGGTTGTWTRGAPHRTTDMVRRLYRTVTTSSGTTYYFVKEFGFGALSVIDDAGSNVGEPIATEQWQMPPANLHGLRMHGSGALVGFVDNTVWTSEPLSVYAFNPAYCVTAEHDIVGVGVIDTIIVACTKGRPMLWQGTTPESLAPIKMRAKSYPCLSKRSIVDGDSVLYASTEGPVEITPSGATLVAQGAFTAKEWARFSPDTMVGEVFDGLYFLAHEATDTEDAQTIILAGGTMVRFNWVVTAFYIDHETGLLYLVVNDLLYEWNADADSSLSLDWQSKEMVVARPLNLGAALVDGEFTLTDEDRALLIAEQEAIKAANAAMIAASAAKGSFNAVSFNTLSFNGSLVRAPESVAEASQVVFSLYVRGGQLLFRKVVTNDRPFRLPAGKKYDAFSVRVSGAIKIKSVAISETSQDLRTV